MKTPGSRLQCNLSVRKCEAAVPLLHFASQVGFIYSYGLKMSVFDEASVVTFALILFQV